MSIVSVPHFLQMAMQLSENQESALRDASTQELPMLVGGSQSGITTALLMYAHRIATQDANAFIDYVCCNPKTTIRQHNKMFSKANDEQQHINDHFTITYPNGARFRVSTPRDDRAVGSTVLILDNMEAYMETAATLCEMLLSRRAVITGLAIDSSWKMAEFLKAHYPDKFGDITKAPLMTNADGFSYAYIYCMSEGVRSVDLKDDALWQTFIQ